MYLRNYAHGKPHPGDPYREYVGMRTDQKFFCPHFIKYVAWCMVVAVVSLSCAFLISHGVPFGKVKIYLWLMTVLCSLFTGMLIIVPAKIVIISLVEGICGKKKPVLVCRKIHPSLLDNPDDPDKKKMVLKYRQFNADLYAPTPLAKLQNRLVDIKYHIELRNLTTDLTFQLVFLLAIVYIIHLNNTKGGYYSTEVVKNLVLRGNYTKTIPFSEVTTYKTFLEYLNETLLPALLLDASEYSKPTLRQIRQFHHDQNLPSDVKKRQILNAFDSLSPVTVSTPLFQRGWTMNPTLKLLGKPRLRQLRVRTDSCKQLKELKGRNVQCAADLTLFNIETGTFSLAWKEGSPKDLTPAQASPWAYQSAWDTRTLPLVGKYSIYPGGGYVLELAKDVRDARIVLEFLDEFNWVDIRTRAVMVEFTVYCVNTNLLNVVTLIAEKTGSGYIVPSYEINTVKLMFMALEPEAMLLFLVLFFFFFMFLFIFREGLRMCRTGIVPYLKRSLALVDLGIMLLGVINMIFIICRNHYVNELLEDLEESSNNEFISFIYAASWHNCSIHIGAFLISFSFFKLIHLMTFRVVFFQGQETLSHCYKYFASLFLKEVVVLLAFAFFFYLTLLSCSNGFESFEVSMSTLIWGSIALDENLALKKLVNSPLYLGPLFFVVFVFVIILFSKAFVAVVCFYIREIHEVSILDKYNLLKFIKYSMLRKRQTDILHLKEQKSLWKDLGDSSVMRLKGGRKGKSAKNDKTKCDNVTIKNSTKMEDEDEKDSVKIKLSEFIRRKPYDTTEYKDLPQERAFAMRHLMLSFLFEEEKTKDCARSLALKALFYSFATARAEAERANSAHGRYFYVDCRCTTVVQDASKFLKMKKVVEDMAREKGWLEDEESILCEAWKVDENLSALDRKLCLLMKRQKPK